MIITRGAMDTQTQTVLIRVLIIFICAWITAEAWRIKRIIDTPRFSRFAYKLFLVFAFFTVARLLATVGDAFLSLNVGWCSTLVNAGFFIYFGAVLRKQRHIIENSTVDVDGHKRISTIVNEGFEELRAIQDRLKVQTINR